VKKLIKVRLLPGWLWLLLLMIEEGSEIEVDLGIYMMLDLSVREERRHSDPRLDLESESTRLKS
jgi:hypothetical protein